MASDQEPVSSRRFAWLSHDFLPRARLRAQSDEEPVCPLPDIRKEAAAKCKDANAAYQARAARERLRRGGARGGGYGRELALLTLASRARRAMREREAALFSRG